MGEILSMSKFGKSKLGQYITDNQISQQLIAEICSVRRETVSRWCNLKSDLSPVQRITHEHINTLIQGLYEQRDIEANPEDLVDDTILKSRCVPCVGIMDDDAETIILRKGEDVKFVAHYPDDYLCLKLPLPQRTHYYLIKSKKLDPYSSLIANKAGLIVFKDIRLHPYFGIDFKINHIQDEIGVTGIKEFQSLMFKDHEKVLAKPQKIFDIKKIDYIQLFVGTQVIYE